MFRCYVPGSSALVCLLPSPASTLSQRQEITPRIQARPFLLSFASLL